MILLYNQEAILAECLRSANLRLANALGVPTTWVQFKPKRNDAGKLLLDCSIVAPEEIPEKLKRAKVFTESKYWVKEVIGKVMQQTQKEYGKRATDAGCI